MVKVDVDNEPDLAVRFGVTAGFANAYALRKWRSDAAVGRTGEEGKPPWLLPVGAA